MGGLRAGGSQLRLRSGARSAEEVSAIACLPLWAWKSYTELFGLLPAILLYSTAVLHRMQATDYVFSLVFLDLYTGKDTYYAFHAGTNSMIIGPFTNTDRL